MITCHEILADGKRGRTLPMGFTWGSRQEAAERAAGRFAEMDDLKRMPGIIPPPDMATRIIKVESETGESRRFRCTAHRHFHAEPLTRD